MMRWLRGLLSVPVALWVLFEEWGWEPLQRAMAVLARMPWVAWLEWRVQALPPYAALAVLAVPMLVLLPVKFGALWLIARGHRLEGLGLIVAAKLFSTAWVARIFALTQPALMRLAWFARVHARWTHWKHGIFAMVRASWPWRMGRIVKRQVRRMVDRVRRST
jgi:hypothetical protein